MSHYVTNFSLSGSLRSSYSQRRPCLFVRSLEHLGKPSHHPPEQRFITLGDIFQNVLQEQRAITFCRLEGKAAPEIERAFNRFPGGKNDAVISSAIWMIQPEICLALFANTLIRIIGLE